MKKKLWLSLALALMLALGLSTAAWAAEKPPVADATVVKISGEKAGTAAQRFYAEGTFQRQIYDILRKELHRIALEGGSTVIKIPLSDLGINRKEIFKEEYLIEATLPTSGEGVMMKRLFYDENMLRVLINDCSPDLYWVPNRNGSNSGVELAG